MPRSYPTEFRRKVLDLLKAGRSVADLAAAAAAWRRAAQIYDELGDQAAEDARRRLQRLG